MSTRTTVVTVCYNSTSIVPALLSSLPKGAAVVLVDNASRDTDTLRGIAADHGAQLIECPRNAGFGAGCNAGAAAADTEFLFFLNPDTEVDPDCIKALETTADRYPTASAFNPRLLDGKGKLIFRSRTKLDPLKRTSGPASDQPTEIATLLGAAIFVRRATFNAIGGFDQGIFLYHEDDDLALRLREHGPLMRAPEAVVTHQEGRGSPRTPQVAALKAYHMARSKVYAYAKHKRRLPWIRTFAEALVSFVTPLMLSPRKRAKAVGFLKGTWSARRDGGRSTEA